MKEKTAMEDKRQRKTATDYGDKRRQEIGRRQENGQETARDGRRRQEMRTKLDTDAGLHARPFKTHTRAWCP